MAAGVWDRMLAFLGFEEEEEGEDDVLLAAPAASPPPAVAPALRVQERRRAAARQPAAAWAERPAARATGSVTRLVAAAPGLVVCAPKRFEDSQEAADHLKAGKPVILHLDGMERELVQRVINFLAGSVYALGGEMHRVGSVVLFVPAGIEVTLPLSLRMAERESR